MDLLDYSVEQSLQTLRSGGIILYPTDTVWGIGCDATNADAVKKIFRLKQRDDKKSLIILLADEKDIAGYVKNPAPAVFNYLKTVSKPTTVIYDNAINLPPSLVPEDNSIAIRIIKESFCSALIKQLGKPIVSTSANISGAPSPKNFSAIAEEIIRGVDYVSAYRRDDKTPAVPSMIIKMQADGNIKIIRE